MVDPEFQGKGQETDAEVVQGDDRRRVREDLSFYRQKRSLFGWQDAQNDRFKISSARWWEDDGADIPLLQRLAI